MKKTLLFLMLCVTALSAAAQETDNPLIVPETVKPFVEKDTKAIAVETADLNGDGTKDFVLVLEKANPEKGEYDLPINQRPLLILTSDKEGKLTLAKRNEKVVMCSQCGGIFGDPFEGVSVGAKTLTVSMYGGSNWRWAYSYKFNYSKIDKTWQLVQVFETSYHTSDPNKIKDKTYTPPRSFGKIDFADFDPASFKGKGKK